MTQKGKKERRSSGWDFNYYPCIVTMPEICSPAMAPESPFYIRPWAHATLKQDRSLKILLFFLGTWKTFPLSAEPDYKPCILFVSQTYFLPACASVHFEKEIQVRNPLKTVLKSIKKSVTKRSYSNKSIEKMGERKRAALLFPTGTLAQAQPYSTSEVDTCRSALS